MREKAVQERQARRESQVTMYRKYRSGDLPDIQIKYSYIIAPLQALAHRDNTVAKLLFSGIFKAIFDMRESVKTESELEAVILQINTSLDTVLSMSTQYFPPFIGCILDILYSLCSTLKVSVDNIGAGSLFSKLQPLGIVVLEEKLLDVPLRPPSAKRFRKEAPVPEEVPKWIELSRLYKSVEEFDTVLGIFSGKIGTQPVTQDAVQAEARGDYSTALKKYEEALNCTDWPSGQVPPDAEMDLWEDCKMDCLQNLCQWSDLEKMASGIVDSSDPPNLSKLWEDTYLQEHFLPFILRSKVKQMLQDGSQQSLLHFVDAAMMVPNQRLVLENSFSEELALMYLWQEDFNRARHYCNMALQAFLQEWSSTDSLMLASRTSTLQKLQPLVELQEFLNFMEDEGNFRTVGPAQTLVREWNQRTPHLLTDPISIWDDVVTNRTAYLNILSSRLQVFNDSQDASMEIDGGDDIFLDTKLRLKLKMAESCKEQNNFTLTLRLLKETRSVCKKSDNPQLMCEWTHLYASTHQKKTAHSLEAWSCDTLNTLIGTLDQLGKIEETEGLASSASLARRHYVLCGQGFKLVALGLQDMDLSQIEGANKLSQKLLEYTGLKKLDKQELIEQLLSTGYQKMKASLSVDDRPGTSETVGQADAHLATAIYCDKILRMKEDGELTLSGGTLDVLPETVVICMLTAMKLDSQEAVQQFPRLLQIVEVYPETIASFIAKSGKVPCWMFLMWISQMLAILDKPESRAIHHILEQLATIYPQAVVYPLKLSSEGYKFATGKHDKMNQSMLDRLNQLLSPAKVPLTDRLISALECFGQPDQDIKELLDEILKLLSKGKKDKVKGLYKGMYNRILDYKKREKLEGLKSPSKKSQGPGDSTADDDRESLVMTSVLDIGSYARKFADKFKGEFDKKFGENGKKMLTMSAKDFNNVKQQLIGMFENEVKASKGSLKPPEKLSEYSKWMANFNPNHHGRGLEIPGQYTGLCKPIPEYHVKISGFDQRVKVMTSIRKPKRICIRGNDEKEYMFLVKGGEDLRQDQRIEQLFFIMNQVLSKDPACNQRKLALKTYQVIPMTPRVGLIEWVSNTIPLKEFILESFTEQERKLFSSNNGPNAIHSHWITEKSKKGEKSWPVKYASLYKNAGYDETKKQFQKTEDTVPWDMMRRSFQHLSTCPEAFHVLRSHCMKSHALLCICQYILGIGDRHLSNFMVNLGTGEMVGIDFGHAFGSATQFLPVPELIPFRLTRQLRNLMLPLDVNGLVENTMIHVLRALRSNSDLLLNTMDIFIKEPSLDWLNFAEKQASTMRETDSEQTSQETDIQEMYPKEKIAFVKRKLRGWNSCHITREELYLGHGKKPAFKDFERVLMGQPDSVRHNLPAQGLTVEQQVAALIDQATDPDILGRTWVGWEPWM